MAPKIETENNTVIDNLAKYTGITAMREARAARKARKMMMNDNSNKSADSDTTVEQEEDPIPMLSPSEMFRKETADGLKKESHESALDYLQRRAAKLETSEDADYLISSVAAVSKEIETKAKFCHKYDISNLFEDGDLHFYSAAYTQVHIHSTKDENEDPLTFKAQTELLTKTFFAMPELPEILTEFVGKTWKDDDGELNHDYKKFAEKALLLQVDVSRPFLLILREHLQEVLMALKEIEAWLLEAFHDVKFLNELFVTDLELPWVDKPSLCSYCIEDNTCLCDTFKSEIKDLLTTNSFGDMEITLKVRTDKERMRCLVAAAEANLSTF